LLAVVDDVDAGRHLRPDDVVDGRAGPCLERRGRRAARVVLPQDRHQLGGARQAPDVRRQNSHGPGLTFAGRDVSTFLI